MGMLEDQADVNKKNGTAKPASNGQNAKQDANKKRNIVIRPQNSKTGFKDPRQKTYGNNSRNGRPEDGRGQEGARPDNRNASAAEGSEEKREFRSDRQPRDNRGGQYRNQNGSRPYGGQPRGDRQERTDRGPREDRPERTDRGPREDRPGFRRDNRDGQAPRGNRTDRPGYNRGEGRPENRPADGSRPAYNRDRNDRGQDRPRRDFNGGQGGYNRDNNGGGFAPRGERSFQGPRGGYNQGGFDKDRDNDNDKRGQGRGGRPMGRGGASGAAKPAVDAKPIEKESRSNRSRFNEKDKVEKVDKFDRKERAEKRDHLDKNGKSGKNNRNVKTPAPVAPPAPKEETVKTIVLPEMLTISELADKMKVKAAEIVKKLFLQGKMVTVNQDVDFDTAEEIAMEFNCICEKEEKVDVLEELLKESEESEDLMVTRPPVVCVMGHVDHGKTSLLDAIRKTHVTDKEAGGITQHIGAYVVNVDGQKITFLDTPGHEAFTAMRMRGANATDIAILVVAADDGVMPQTEEAISHARAAGTDIIVAINKIDKPSANIDRVKKELAEHELIPEDWGGSTVCVPVSAHTKEGLDELLEMILLTAEVAELKANPNRSARGLVIEAELDKGKGPVATVLVQKGTLHVGDPIAAGSCYGKVRAMMDDKGRRVKEAGPSTPVEILGFSDVPGAGEIMISPDSEKEARAFAETFISEGRERMLEETKSKMSLDDLFSKIQEGNLKELNLIIKADVQGSTEAVKQSLLKLSNEEVVVKCIHGGVGAINESDVSLAAASGAIIIGFNVRPDATAKATAEREGVDVRLYRVIYDAINDVQNAMKGMLDPIFEEKVIGHAEVRQLFKASGVGTIAGSYVLDGTFQRGSLIRISREGKQIYEGKLASLKRFKDDVKEVRAGYECGLVFEKYNEVQELDIVEAYIMVEVPR